MTYTDYHRILLDLEEPAGRIQDGINALGLMAMGLSMEKDPYADGFNAVWNYLANANQDFQEQIKSCLNIK